MGWTGTHSIEVAAPPSVLWRRCVEVGAWPSWHDGVERAHLDGPFRVGARGLLTMRSGPKTPFVVTAIDEGTAFETVTQLPGAAVRTKILIEARRGGTSAVSAEATLRGPLAFAYRRFLTPGLAAGVALGLARLAASTASPDDPTDA